MKPVPQHPGPGIVRPARRPAGWRASGPAPRGAQGDPALLPGPDEDLCYLSGDWRILQKRRGHRWSVDDLLTAWLAARCWQDRHPDRAPDRFLDLGCGIGSVLMLLAWRFPDARGTGIEAQPTSAAMARRSLRWNDADGRCEVHDGDIREPQALPTFPPFPLITGTPPYFEIGRGVESQGPQKAPCRFEHRGGAEVYLQAGARCLAEDGLQVVCVGPAQSEASLAEAHRLGLGCARMVDVIGAPGRPPRFHLLVFTRERGAQTAREALPVRDRAGQWTPTFREVRKAMGLPDRPPAGSEDAT